MSGAAVLFGIIGAYPYIKGLIDRSVKPHLFSWLIWTIVCATATAIQIAEGGGVGSLALILNTLFFLGITISSFWIGTKDIKKSDWLTLVIALSALFIWLVLGDPLKSVFIVTSLDVIAYYPTIRKSWAHPEQEPALTWFISCLEYLCAILALEHYTATTYLYPASLVAMNFTLASLLIFRRRILGMPITGQRADKIIKA